MNELSGKDVQGYAVGIALLLVTWATFKGLQAAKEGAASVGTGISKFSDGVLFMLNPWALPPDIEATQSAQERQRVYIELGYAYIDTDGVFRITPKGEAYINSQKGNV